MVWLRESHLLKTWNNALFNTCTCAAHSIRRVSSFFDVCSVVKTRGNRTYGHSQIGSLAVEIKRYASTATFTGNLLHRIFRVSHVNAINGRSNRLELLNFFSQALEEKDVLDNLVVKEGDN